MALRDHILHNFWQKLVALALATAVWFTFQYDKLELRAPEALFPVTSFREFVRHPITKMNSAGDPRAFRIIPDEVDLTVSGEPSVLKKLSGQDIHAFVDLTSVEGVISTNKIRIHAPAGVKLEKATPEVLRIEVVESN